MDVFILTAYATSAEETAGYIPRGGVLVPVHLEFGLLAGVFHGAVLLHSILYHGKRFLRSFNSLSLVKAHVFL